MRPGDGTDVMDKVISIDAWRHAIGPFIGVVDAVNLHGLSVPRVNICNSARRYPAKLTGAVFHERQGGSRGVAAGRGLHIGDRQP